jgi:tetratricopeptide (TPR) repeat protein
MVPILFVIKIDPTMNSTPFANIEAVRANQKDEILFSMHSVFRIIAIELMPHEHMYEVQLELVSHEDKQLRYVIERLEQEVAGSTGWDRLGKLLINIRKIEKAEEIYNILLEHPLNEEGRSTYYHRLGCIQDVAGNNQEALSFYTKALTIRESILSGTHPDLAALYNDIGGVYYSIKEYPTALSFYMKALIIRENILSGTHPDLAASYNNIGGVYFSNKKYLKALSFFEKALVIHEAVLQRNHRDLTISYIKIGLVYFNIEQYLTALQFYEKAKAIQEEYLAPNDPDLATSYNYIGLVYSNTNDDLKALSFYEHALKIRQVALGLDHMDTKAVVKNIELVKHKLHNSR